MAEEIHIEKLNEQWAGIPHKKLLNQSFQDQLNSLQILQLAPLELAKQHLPADIIDILKHLEKADNIPFNQLYYIAENCLDWYYSKVIKTFVAIIKRQFADRQLLLVNTAHLFEIPRRVFRQTDQNLEDFSETPQYPRRFSGLTPTF